MAVNFYLDSRADKKGDSPIRLSVSISGARFVTSTGYKIASKKWDSNKQQVKKGCSNSAGVSYTVINASLSKIVEHFSRFENECITKGKKADSKTLKDEFSMNFGRSREAKEKKSLSFFDYMDMFVSEMGDINQWTDGTRSKFAALKNHLKDFDKDISFRKFDEKGLNAFVSFLREDKQMKNTTISKQLSFTKWFLRWATAKGYNDNVAFKTFAPKLKIAPKKVVFLDWGELMRVFNFDIPKNGDNVILTRSDGTQYTKEVHDAAAIAKTRDIFCFCCFTSLRYSDALNLKRSDISGDSITITTIKTADTIKIELNKYAVAILRKYEERQDLGGFVFPSITNQRMNVYVKELCELCEINQPVTQTYYTGNKRMEETLPKYELIGTHTGRRTFICNALMLGIPAEIVMKWTGHSDYKSMKPYIDVTNAAKAKAMKLFDEL